LASQNSEKREKKQEDVQLSSSGYGGGGTKKLREEGGRKGEKLFSHRELISFLRQIHKEHKNLYSPGEREMGICGWPKHKWKKKRSSAPLPT